MASDYRLTSTYVDLTSSSHNHNTYSRTIFFIAESRALPNEYNYGRSILCGVTRCIGDPGNFVGTGPVALTGRIIASCIGACQYLQPRPGRNVASLPAVRNGLYSETGCQKKGGN